tara:strand:- start:410 stop:1012 length:603 start_codon:yes stop_codon:yes gene_type:complete
MKNKLVIFCNQKIKNFLSTLLPEYELKFMKLDTIKKNIKVTQANVIFINNTKDSDIIDCVNLSENCLIISNLKNISLNYNYKTKLINAPISINYIKNTIENFLQNLKIQFHDILINKEKLINLKNKNFCYLTKVELEILIYLIREREASKNFIKENILNIKSNIETNSLESHLTRIRKKMRKVKTEVNIYTKNEKLLIAV